MGVGHGWTVTWMDLDDTGRSDKIEVFTSPDGHWYRRAHEGDTVDLEVGPLVHTGLMLRLTSIDHWRPAPDG